MPNRDSHSGSPQERGVPGGDAVQKSFELIITLFSRFCVYLKNYNQNKVIIKKQEEMGNKTKQTNKIINK